MHIALKSDSCDNTTRRYLDLPKEEDKIRRYVVTMGPLHPTSYMGTWMPKKKAAKLNTCEEFWKLCWMTESKIIVMLCAVSPGFQVTIYKYIHIYIYNFSWKDYKFTSF